MLNKETIAELRRRIDYYADDGPLGEFKDQLRELLDAAEENERLRGLLIEAKNHATFVDSYHRIKWQKKVEEALK